MSEFYEKLRVPEEKLRWVCDPESLGFKTTAEIKSIDKIIGQERALNAIKVGLEMSSPGYNIFVAGLTGTGKTTTVKQILEQVDLSDHLPPDICYVNNFDKADEPHVLKLSAGDGCSLKKDMEDLVADLQNRLPKLLDSEQFKKRQKKVLEGFQEKSVQLIGEFEKKVKEQGLAVVQLQVGQVTRPELMPLVNNEVVPWQQLEKMVHSGDFSQEQLDELKKKHETLHKELEKIIRDNRKIEKQIQKNLQELRHIFVQPIITGHIFELKERYNNKDIDKYLDVVERHMLDNLSLFTETEQPQQDQGTPFGFLMAPRKKEFVEYEVNVVVDNGKLKRRPVVIETAPNYRNMFGTVERVVDRSGATYTDFTKIKAGSLLAANGGFLVVDLIDMISEPGVWKALKRTLKNNKLDIQSYDPLYIFGQTALKPEPINIDIKVVVIGDSYLYHLLFMYDEDFRKIFKIRADFDTVMKNDQKAIKSYARFVKKISEDEKLLPFANSGVARIIEYGIRLSGRQNKLSTRFSDVADIIREADYWAKQDKSAKVTDKHVHKAIQEKIFRSQMTEEKLQEMISEGTILIDVKGKKTGQVNGLAVYNMGDYSFGKPSRITATVGAGTAGIINIEREADMSGKTHNKGVLIIGGFFRQKYGSDKPINFSASLAFEQSYSGVDGDSASSTEIYALLSELSGIPLRQDIAVTGSVNQKGEIQPIGGVNQKIEGFFDACKALGLSGKQGVLIPHQNVKDLMLRADVVDASRKGRFFIYAVKTIDQGIEILTGIEAGKKSRSGKYPENSIHYKVEKRLQTLRESIKKKPDHNKDK